MLKLKKSAVVGLAVASLVSLPLLGGTASAGTPTAQCTKQKVNSTTGQASCSSLGAYKKYRVIVDCIGNSGRQFSVTGPWVSKGWSVAQCSGNGSAGIYGFIDVELQF